jgi:hypothetical protein
MKMMNTMKAARNGPDNPDSALRNVSEPYFDGITLLNKLEELEELGTVVG